MCKVDPSSGTNLPSGIRSNTYIPILFPEDFEVWAMYFEDYITGIEDHGLHMWETIMKGPHACSKTNMFVYNQSDYSNIVAKHDLTQDEKDMLRNDLRAKRDLQFALTPNTLRLISSLNTAKHIWDRSKKLYSRDEDQTHSIRTNMLSELGSFKQKDDETLDQTVDRFNHLLSKMLKHGLERTVIEHKVTFLNGLRAECKSIVSNIKAHE